MLYRGFSCLSHLWLVACGLPLTAYRLKLASASASALHRRCQVRLDGGQHGLEALRIAGNDLALFQELVATGEVADQAARFLNEQASGGHVPFGEIGRASCRERV